MADSKDFWGDFAKRLGNEGAGSGFSGFAPQDNLFSRLRNAPAWKTAILGGASLMALGIVFTGVLAAMSALVLLLTLFGLLLGGGERASAPAPFPMDSPPTFH